MEVVPASVLDRGNSSRLTEELGNCASNTQNGSFNVEASLGCRDRIATTRVNGQDTFCMEGSIDGHDRVTGTSLNGQDSFPMEGSPGGHDRVTSTGVNGQDIIPMEGSPGGHDGVTGTRVNGHDTFPIGGSPSVHDRVIATRVNDEDTCGVEVACSGHDQVIATRVNGEDSFCTEGSLGGHDGVMSTRVNGQDNFPIEGSPSGHDRVIATTVNGEETCVEVACSGHDQARATTVNGEDSFCTEGSLGGHDGVMSTRVNGQDNCPMEGSPGGHDRVIDRRVNEADTFCMEASLGGYDGVMTTRVNDEDTCVVEVAFSGHDPVIATRVNGEDTFCMEGSLGGHDGVTATRVNVEDTCCVEAARSGQDRFIATTVNGEDAFCMEGSLGGHDGVTATIVNGEDAFCMPAAPDGHDRVMDTKGNVVDSEVDIIGNVVLDEGEGRMVERDTDETESSSSFGFTDSESGVAEASGDMEVESELRDDDAPLMGINGCSDLFRTRKKKLTAHWRDYIRPLMWRLKWAELHIRELQSQASKYGRELADYDRRKQCELQKCATEDNATKLTPFVCQNRSVKLMKRKKRKRVEEAVDLASYTSCHSLLSHFARKRSGGDSTYLDDDHGHTGKTPSDEFGCNGDWLLLDFKDGDALESMLRKIEETQAHARKLRLRMDTVVRDAEKFASHKSSFTPRAPLPGYGSNSVLLHSNVETVPLGSMLATCQQSSITGDVTHLPNMTTTTDQPHIKRTCKKIEDKVLLSDKSIKKELNDNEDVQTRLIAESQSALEGKAANSPCVSDTKSVRKVSVSQEQPAVKLRIYSKFATPKNKKKRGRRKARTGRWSQRSSG